MRAFVRFVVSLGLLLPLAVQANFYTPVSVAGAFFGGPRAFQFAARIEF
jgi:hypothetical protein